MEEITSKDQEAGLIKELEQAIPMMTNARDKEFAASMVSQYHKKGSLSMKQWPWVGKLIQHAICPEPEPAKMLVQVGDMNGLIKMFSVAQKHLKYPKITLKTETGVRVQLSVAGEKSKYKGQINVTDGGGFQSGTWYGRVDLNGVWEPSRNVDMNKMADISKLLMEMSINPAETAIKYGQLTGKCCFCNTELTHDKSTAVGFGETCAKHFGLHDQWKAATKVLGGAA